MASTGRINLQLTPKTGMNNEEIIKKINSHLNNSSHLDGYLIGEKKTTVLHPVQLTG